MNDGLDVHFFIIEVRKKYPSDDIIECYKWSDLRFDLRVKYDWYFTYRAALLQVKYPKYLIETRWGKEPAENIYLEQLRKNKIRAKKAKITECKNKLEQAKREWDSLFPIDEDILYKSAVAKIQRLEIEFEMFVNYKP